MAIIDSLSRDLAVSEMVHNNKSALTKNKINSTEMVVRSIGNTKVRKPISFDPRLSALILLPLLHVPHILIATAFDTLSTHDTPSSSGSKLSGLFIWAFILAITNLMVDKAVITVPAPLAYLSDKKFKSHRILPGSFTQQTENHDRQIMQSMHQFCLDNEAVHMQYLPSNPKISFLKPKGLNLKRRNSL
jgi:hypothetical protein